MLPEGCFALDVDGEAIPRLADLAETLGPLPSTLTTRTAHGTHVVLRWPAGMPQPIGNLFGIVTRWGGNPGSGYVIGPRSVHATGFVYDLERRTLEVATLPDAWAAAAVESQHPDHDDVRAGYQVPESIGEGLRYEAIRDYVASRYMRGIGKDEMWAGVRDVLAPRMRPSLSDDELRER